MAYLYWHHVVGAKFQLIVDSGVILPSTHEDTGTAVARVWFARDAFWEKIADRPWVDHVTAKYYRMRRDELAAEQGLGRIGVRPETLPLDPWHLSRVLQRNVERVFPPSSQVKCWNFGVDGRNSVAAVPSIQWQNVQIWRQSTWIDVPFEKHDCGLQP